jgi:hypothetical protein
VLKKIVVVIVVVVAVILVYAATRSDNFVVQRSTTIKAPAGKIVAFINDFRNWGAWSPWEQLDLAMKRTFSGGPSGNGSVYEWSGDSKVGAGRMEIMESSPSKVTIKLDFLKPIEGHNIAEFVLVPSGDATKVTWEMRGPSPYVAKVMGVFMSMDKMIGNDFETGLANLKAAAEK